MGSFSVSLYLTVLLALFILVCKKFVSKGSSITVLFWLLFFMVSPGFIIDVQSLFFWGKIEWQNITLFSILLFFTAIPWISFEKWYKTIPAIKVTDQGVAILDVVFKIVIVSCLFSYIYIAPYALRSYTLGAVDTRALVNSDASVLPSTIFTTFAVGVSSISPFYVFFFYLSLLHKSLKKYSVWLFLSSFVYIWVSMPFMARDGFVTLPIFFIIFFVIFQKSLNVEDVKKVKRYIIVLAGIAGSLLLIYSLSRFYNSSDGLLGLIDGTWGYIYQQPYVFDITVREQHNWHGLSLRFPLLADIFGQPVIEVFRTEHFETMFGTMLSEFYSIGGYWSLFVFTGAFVLIYHISLRSLIRRGNCFNVFLLFIVYLIIEITGLFYYRYGGYTFNWLFLILTILPFLLSSRIITIKNEDA